MIFSQQFFFIKSTFQLTYLYRNPQCFRINQFFDTFFLLFKPDSTESFQILSRMPISVNVSLAR